MRATRCLLYKGFWGRSADELKRLTKIVRSLEAVKGPSGPYPLHSLESLEGVQDCKVMCDTDIGGFSSAHLEWIPPSGQKTNGAGSGYARFHGNISIKLPEDRPEVHRSGYAAWRTRDRPATIFGRSVWDIDPYTYLALRVKTDGRSYMVNVQTESLVPTDLHQHRLFTKRPGEWETVLIKWNDFVRTNYGFAVEPQTEILRRKVRTLGVGLTDRVPGPFELCVARLWATNDINEAACERAVAYKEGSLKNKHGENVAWACP